MKELRRATKEINDENLEEIKAGNSEIIEEVFEQMQEIHAERVKNLESINTILEEAISII